jgi:hypothetical protein
VSFIDRNKRWLLPVLGLAVVGVIWLNLPGASERVEPAAVNPAPEAVLPTQTPAPAEAVTSDLKALEAPPPLANDPQPLLLAGRRALTGDLRRAPVPPALHPDLWRGLGQDPPPVVVAVARMAAPVAGPPPTLDFVIETATRREAWVKGRPYRQGATTDGGYTFKRIGTEGVVVAGPAGDVELHPKAGRGQGGKP